jgi:nucleoid-associated protein YgaU
LDRTGTAAVVDGTKWGFVMAKDAKIGSLIGLVLIFIMAFVINGFTRSGGSKNSGASNPASVAYRGDSATGNYRAPDLSNTEQAEDEIPASDAGVTDSSVLRPAIESPVPEQITNGDSDISESEPAMPSLSEIYYTVCEGDNLAEIAKQFYGSKEGNRRANILRLFEANRNVLTSPHTLSIGQKLLIPRLEVLKADGNRAGHVFADSMFEMVGSIGRKPLSSPDGNANQTRLYAVQEGDSLWSIADNLLGDGSRYTEIRDLNSIILRDENLLSVGMRLRIPSQ